MAADAPRTKTFLLARPEERALKWMAARLPARVHARPPDRARRARRARDRGGLPAVERPPRAAVGGERAARRALARRLARRDARALPPHRAPDVRLLPRPPRRRVRHRGDLHRPRPLAAHAARDRAGDRRRLPAAVDQHVPRDVRVRPLRPRLRPRRPDRDPRRADRPEHRAGAGRRSGREHCRRGHDDPRRDRARRGRRDGHGAGRARREEPPRARRARARGRREAGADARRRLARPGRRPRLRGARRRRRRLHVGAEPLAGGRDRGGRGGDARRLPPRARGVRAGRRGVRGRAGRLRASSSTSTSGC